MQPLEMQHDFDVLIKHTEKTFNTKDPAGTTLTKLGDEERERHEKMWGSGTVVESKSDDVAPIVLIRKQTGWIRWWKRLFCLSECRTLLGYFGWSYHVINLDLQTGYYQNEVYESDRKKRLSSWAQSTFQREMEFIFQGIQYDIRFRTVLKRTLSWLMSSKSGQHPHAARMYTHFLG